MLSRRSILFAAVVASAAGLSPAFAASSRPFDAQTFADAQNAGKPILVVIHAPWCPTCKTQAPILSELTSDPKFKALTYLVVDFDGQKDLVQRFGARMQSTLIAFKGKQEVGRSVGDTNRASISSLLDKMI